MSLSWPKTELGELIDTLKGCAFKSKDYVFLGIPIVRVSDFTEDSISENNLVYLPESLAEEYSAYKLQHNNVVIQTVGSWQYNPASVVGKVVRVPRKLSSSLLNQNAVKLIPNQNIDEKFLYYRLKDGTFKAHVLGCAQGAANQASITLSTIKRFKFFLPPLEAQQKIAAILSAYDDLIENNLIRIKLLDEMAQITYEEWFVRLKFPGHETTSIDLETGLPVGWEKTTLGNCCVLVMGQSPKSEFYNYEEGGLPFHQGVKDYGFRFPQNTCWSTDGSRIAKYKDILFSVRAPVGRLNIAIEDIILGRGLSAIRHKNGLQSFLFYQLKQIFFQEDMLGGGAIFASVTKEDMLRIELLKPDQRIETEFNQFATAIDQNIENLHRQNQLLKEARDILLPRLMTGMIDLDSIQLPGSLPIPGAHLFAKY